MLEDSDLMKEDVAERHLNVKFQCHMSEQDQGCVVI